MAIRNTDVIVQAMLRLPLDKTWMVPPKARRASAVAPPHVGSPLVKVTARRRLGAPTAAQTSLQSPLRDRGPRQRQSLDRSRGSCFVWRAGSPVASPETLRTQMSHHHWHGGTEHLRRRRREQAAGPGRSPPGSGAGRRCLDAPGPLGSWWRVRHTMAHVGPGSSHRSPAHAFDRRAPPCGAHGAGELATACGSRDLPAS
jgi:hypothetical protein